MSKTLDVVRDQAKEIKYLNSMVDILVERDYDALSKFNKERHVKHGVTRKVWCERKRGVIGTLALITLAQNEREESSV